MKREEEIFKHAYSKGLISLIKAYWSTREKFGDKVADDFLNYQYKTHSEILKDEFKT